MEDDFAALVKINHEISAAEDQGDAAALGRHLAASLAFRRADGTLVNREQFLQAAKPSGPRRIDVQSVELRGEGRALVTCVVTMAVNGEPKNFDNIRLFTRAADGWKLMAWANEPLG